MPLFTPTGVDLNMLMPVVADDATPIIKVPLPLRGIGRTFRGLVKSAPTPSFPLGGNQLVSFLM